MSHQNPIVVLVLIFVAITGVVASRSPFSSPSESPRKSPSSSSPASSSAPKSSSPSNSSSTPPSSPSGSISTSPASSPMSNVPSRPALKGGSSAAPTAGRAASLEISAITTALAVFATGVFAI